MKKVLIAIVVIVFSLGFSSCGETSVIKMHIIKDSIDVFVSGDHLDKIDSTDVILLYSSKYRTNGKWEIADQAGTYLYNPEVFNSDTNTSYLNGYGEKVPEYYRLARITKKY